MSNLQRLWEELLQEIDAGKDRGETPNFEDLLRRYPNFAGKLRQHFELGTRTRWRRR